MPGIHIYGDAILRSTAAPIAEIGSELKQLAEEMVVAMHENDGVGLAATQIGRSEKIAVIDITVGEKPALVLINPEIAYLSKETIEEEEGCLSIPGIRLPVARAKTVSIKALNIDGNEYTIENAEGILARALQHEIDHLNGILFVDRVSPLQRKLISGKLKKLAKSGGEEK